MHGEIDGYDVYAIDIVRGDVEDFQILHCVIDNTGVYSVVTGFETLYSIDFPKVISSDGEYELAPENIDDLLDKVMSKKKIEEETLTSYERSLISAKHQQEKYFKSWIDNNAANELPSCYLPTPSTFIPMLESGIDTMCEYINGLNELIMILESFNPAVLE